MRIGIIALVLVVALGVAGFMYKDTLLELAGLSGGASYVDTPIDVPQPQARPMSQADVLRNSCEGGNHNDCFALARLYLDGNSVQKDSLMALGILAASCEENHADSCALLAEMYDKGNGVVASSYLYLGYATKACELGNLDACYELGVKYYRGKDELMERDVMRAFKLFKDTCDKGEVKGCNNVAVIYNNGGNGISKNTKLARSLFDDACKKGYQPSCENLAKLKF